LRHVMSHFNATVWPDDLKTQHPTSTPTPAPTASPISMPPTPKPTAAPTAEPTAAPTAEPTMRHLFQMKFSPFVAYSIPPTPATTDWMPMAPTAAPTPNVTRARRCAFRSTGAHCGPFLPSLGALQAMAHGEGEWRRRAVDTWGPGDPSLWHKPHPGSRWASASASSASCNSSKSGWRSCRRCCRCRGCSCRIRCGCRRRLTWRSP
jgi:hypothetical protein